MPEERVTSLFKLMSVMGTVLLTHTERGGTVPRPLCSGIYLPEKGGVRIEDTFIMEENGPRSLFTFTKELLELD